MTYFGLANKTYLNEWAKSIPVGEAHIYTDDIGVCIPRGEGKGDFHHPLRVCCSQYCFLLHIRELLKTATTLAATRTSQNNRF